MNNPLWLKIGMNGFQHKTELDLSFLKTHHFVAFV